MNPWLVNREVPSPNWDERALPVTMAVLHYGDRGTGPLLREGMCFTIEPMVNAGKRGVKLLPDGWTVVTKDRSLSAQWEHTVLVTASGHEVLTRRADEVL